MKAFVFLFVLSMTVLQHPEPYPEGVFCTPLGDSVHGIQTADHPCSCKRMDYDPICEGDPIEDRACMQYCTKAHCRCPILCMTPDGEGH